MLKILLPLFFSVLSLYLIPVGVGWLIISIVLAFSSELTQSIFCFQGVVNPIIILTLWVAGIILYASSPIFSNRGGAWLILCVFLLNLLLVLTFSANNLFSLYFFLESTLIPTLFLIFGWGNQPERLQASAYLLLYTVFGSLPLLIGISVISFQGSISFLCPPAALAGGGVLWLAIIFGFFVNMPIYPVHLWLPNAHVEAPLAGSIALAGILLKLGAYGVLAVGAFVSLPSGVVSSTIAICLWGGVCTSLICLRQTDINALIAYSSIGHIALVLGGLLSCSELGVNGAIVIVVAHGLSSPAMLTFANILYDVSFSRSIVLCNGVASLLPVITLCFFLTCATNMSAPPSINLFGEVWLIISVTILSGITAPVVCIICFLVGAYTLFLYTSVCHGGSPSFANPSHLFNSSYSFIMFIQLWPLCSLVLNLPVIF